jgi:glycosyltransferase involved in cell wall biosynthesis
MSAARREPCTSNTHVGRASKISVIVPTYRRPDDLVRCLDALENQSRAPDEVLVVLRASDECTLCVLEPWKTRLPLVEAVIEEGGQVAAINAGLRSCTGELIAITDDDCRPAQDWLEKVVARFGEDPAIGAVGGRDVVIHDGVAAEGTARVVGRVRWYGRLIGNHHLRAPLQDVDFLKGANMTFRSTAVTPFDQTLRGQGAQVCNDLQASLAVRRRGYRVVYDPGVLVEHRPAPRFDGDSRQKRSLQAVVDEQHNETYVLLSLLPTWQKVLALVYRLTVGTRKAPGLALVPFRVSASPSESAFRTFAAATRGRLLGLFSALRMKSTRGGLSRTVSNAGCRERARRV